MGIGDLVKAYCDWRSWRRWFHRDKQRNLELILDQLNQIDIEGRVVSESPRVQHQPAPARPFAPSDEYLYKKEKRDGNYQPPY